MNRVTSILNSMKQAGCILISVQLKSLWIYVTVLVVALFQNETPAFIQPPVLEHPAFDQLLLADGRRMEGLVIEENSQQVRFQLLLRKPGVRSMIFELVFDRTEVVSIQKAKEPGRKVAVQLMSSIENSKIREEVKRAKLVIQTVKWIDNESQALQFQGPFFELLSNVQEPLLRLVVVRLEEIFSAYVKTLGKRQKPEKPVRIVLFRTLSEYRHWQQKQGIPILNPAVYNAKNGEIHVGSDIDLQTLQLQELRSTHLQQLQELGEEKKKIIKHFGGQPPPILTRQLHQLHLQLLNLDAENEASYARSQAAFFAILYHEAFHAYLDQWVFPSTRYQVPRWLNEGLAQLFESAFVEVDELRIGRIEEKRLRNIQDEIKRGRFMSIREILQTPDAKFIVRHTQEHFESDKYYDASWALAQFLMNKLNMPNGSTLADYVTQSSTVDVIRQFEKLVGMSLAECEKQWRDYLLRLRADGSLRPGNND